MANVPRSPRSRALAQRIAANTLHHGYKSDVVTDLLAEKAVEDIASYVERVVAAAPPLSQEQLNRIAVILRPPDLRESSNFREPSSKQSKVADGGDAA